MYSVPATLTGMIWSPSASRHPPLTTESSFMVMAMGFVEVTTVPTKFDHAIEVGFLNEYVSPPLSFTRMTLSASCPTIGPDGLTVTTVLFCVATTSNEA